MTKFEKVEEKVRFIAWGKSNKKDATSVVVAEGESIEGIIDQIKDSTKGYGKIYTLRVKNIEEPVVVTGKTDLNNKLGYGSMAVRPVKVGDAVQITFVGTYSTKLGKGYKFDVAVARSD